ncbi:NAD(+) diphosphatase [Pseudoalteromonas sp. SSM20]|uniref:NAD(+) diphosphatase n=1 Tax=Pseudoalteromonas sp. SSM20 TaxID=3139394 RepID=UPI003BA8549A
MQNLPFSQMPLARCSRERSKPEFIKTQLNRVDAKVLLFYQDNMLSTSHLDDLLWLSVEHVSQILGRKPHLFLGLDNETPYFAMEISQQELQLDELSCYQTLPFRTQLASFPATSVAIAGYAKTLLHWHKTHVYCGRCGRENISFEGGYSRKCTNKQCGHITFPRHDPAVIMIVKKVFDDGIERCLLGRQASWPTGNYSALAGFVDAGETLEEAVIREVKEESGVDVHEVEYIASQPWPFPSSVMIGFIATASSADIDIGEDELEDARWFSRDELAEFGEWGDETSTFKKPRFSSISRFLLEHWINS